MADPNNPDDPAHYANNDGNKLAPEIIEPMTDSAKIDEIRENLRVLTDTIAKLAAFVTAPQASPSAVEKLVEAIGVLTAETKANGEQLAKMAAVFDGIAVADGSEAPAAVPGPRMRM